MMIEIICINEKRKGLALHHCHSEVELNIFLSGTGVYLVENKKYSVQKGDIFFFLKNTFHCLTDCVEMNLIKIRFLVEDLLAINEGQIYDSLVEAYHESQNRLDVRIPSSSKQSAAIIRIAEQMWQDFQDTGLVDERQKHLLLYILTTIRDYYSGNKDVRVEWFNPWQYHCVIQVVQYIDDNYSESIMLSDLARIAHLSVNRFINVFKHFMGMTPIQYVINRRVTMACNLIMEDQMSITEIAIKSGFNNTANFNKQFLRVVGMTPKEMRKKGHMDMNPKRETERAVNG